MRGVLALVMFLVVFFGSIWLLLSMILGARLGYWVMASCAFGILTILSLIWFGTALGPKGPETTWHAIGAGTELAEVEGFGGRYDISDYPGGGWRVPQEGELMAGMKGEESTASEEKNLEPVMQAFVRVATSPIPGKREEVKDLVEGPLELEPGDFKITDVRMKEDLVQGRASVISVGRAVPSSQLKIVSLGTGVKEGKVASWLVEVGDEVEAGDPVMEASTNQGAVRTTASQSGRVLSLLFEKGERITPGAPIADVDLSGLPGQPEPAKVAAVRVLGSVRRPSFYYLVASVALFVTHLAGLSRTERALRTAPLPA
ncbi:MAG: biotin/lipoyl-containing protein [Actinomycetota bacterium]